MRFVFLGAELCRQLPSDSTSRWTPLLLASGWRLQTPTVDFHHLADCHARHTIKIPAEILQPGFFFQLMTGYLTINRSVANCSPSTRICTMYIPIDRSPSKRTNRFS